jgi:hypothetical protein
VAYIIETTTAAARANKWFFVSDCIANSSVGYSLSHDYLPFFGEEDNLFSLALDSFKLVFLWSDKALLTALRASVCSLGIAFRAIFNPSAFAKNSLLAIISTYFGERKVQHCRLGFSNQVGVLRLVLSLTLLLYRGLL